MHKVGVSVEYYCYSVVRLTMFAKQSVSLALKLLKGGLWIFATIVLKCCVALISFVCHGMKKRRIFARLIIIVSFIVLPLYLILFSRTTTDNIVLSSVASNQFEKVTSHSQGSSKAIVSVYHQSLMKCIGEANAEELISGPPSMVALQKLSIFERVNAEIKSIGTDLLVDQFGSKIDVIESEYGKGENRNREVFSQWLRGGGRKPTWNTLIEVLINAKHKVLADEIASSVRKVDCNVPTLPFAYSEKVLKAIDQLKTQYREHKVVTYPMNDVETKLPFLDLQMRDTDGNSIKTLEDVLETVQERRLLLITGQPGSGKTTLMKYLAKQWADGNVLQTCQILFLILLSLDKYKDEPYYNLSDLLNVEYKDLNVNNLGSDITYRNGNGTCFLLDAFDEKHTHKDFVYELLQKSELPYSVSIVTSRPYDDLININNRVKIIGFKLNELDNYLLKLSDEKTAMRVKQEFWKDRQVKEMCRLPLHMAMVIHIARSTPVSSIRTKTQIYTAFMNATIKHYKHDHHPYWNTHSLRKCILNVLDDDLCKAFKIIRYTAFEMTFNQQYLFSVDTTDQENIKHLGLVSIAGEDAPNREEIKFAFSHPTFMEFFAALHLITLSQSEQRFHVQNPAIKIRQGLVDFYFGLLGDFYANNTEAVALPLQHYTAAFAFPLNRWEHVCPSKFYTAHSSSSLRLHQEIGWKEDAYKRLLQSARIVKNSSACISVTNETISYSHYLLEHAKINRLSIVGYSATLSAVSFEDVVHPLSVSHLKLLECLSSLTDCINIPLYSSVTYVHLKINEYLIQSETNFNSAIRNLKIFYKMQSFGLTVHDYNLLSYNEDIEGLSLTSIEVHSCYGFLPKNLMQKQFVNITTLYVGVHGYTCKHYLMERQVQRRMPHSTLLSRPGQLKSLMRRRMPLLTLLSRPDQLKSLIFQPTLSMTIEKMVSGLSALRYLRIEKMVFTGATAQQLIDFTNKDLTVLDLSHCRLKGIAKDILGSNLSSFLKLQNLNFYEVGLTDSDVNALSESIRKLTSLTYLGLASNEINGEGLQQLVNVLKTIQTFRSLNLFGNPITGQENIEVLSQMKNLQTLHISISNNDDKDALFRVVKDMPQLASFRWSLLESD